MRNKKLIGGIIALCAVILIAAFVVFSWSSSTKREGWYAVFLTNQQVYFGNVDHTSKKELFLKNIYYIQPNQATGGDLTLLKLGNELHGPEDGMEINRDHILFIEKLKEDGRVVKAIQAFKK